MSPGDLKAEPADLRESTGGAEKTASEKPSTPKDGIIPIPASQDRRPTSFPLTDNPSCYAVAVVWLSAGVTLLPLQPNTKHFVRTFGPHSKRISTDSEAWAWFGRRRSNMAVVTGNGLIVLDIDQPAALEALLSAHPDLRNTWTIKTKRGVHLYTAGPAGARSGRVGDVEVKAAGAAVVTWPSRVGDFTYRPLQVAAPFVQCPSDFLLLSAPLPQQVKPVVAHVAGDDLVARIKAEWSLINMFEPLTRLRTTNGRWYHGLCPFHSDTQPSFWLDSERQVFGCYSCKAHGDAINAYALLHAVTVADAIRQMAGRLP